MDSSIKKSLIIASISLLSFGLVWGAWAFSDRGGRDSYKAAPGQTLLKATSPANPGESKTLKDWEKNLIERESPNLRAANYTEDRKSVV